MGLNEETKVQRKGVITKIPNMIITKYLRIKLTIFIFIPPFARALSQLELLLKA